MLMMLARLIGSLSSYGTTAKIAFAMAFGFVLALISQGTVIWFLIFIPMMLIRVNQAAMLGTMALVGTIARFVDPLSERLGYWFLNFPGLYQPMGRFLSLPGVGWFRIDDSLITGSLFLALLGWPLFFLLSMGLIVLYRRYLAAAIKKALRLIGSKLPLLSKFSKAFLAAREMGLRS